jgi:hypothetical protein
MLFCVVNKAADMIIPILPESGENGFVSIKKVENLQTGNWEARYGPKVLKIGSTEGVIDTFFTNLRTFINSRTPGSCMRVSDIEAII